MCIPYAGATTARDGCRVNKTSVNKLNGSETANASHNTYRGAKLNLCIAPTWLQIECSVHQSLSILLEGRNGRPIPGSRGAWKYVHLLPISVARISS